MGLFAIRPSQPSPGRVYQPAAFPGRPEVIIWLDGSTTASLLAELSQAGLKKEDGEAPKIASLSGRERDVITLIGEGLNNKRIAERLYISETTVRHHLTSIFSKLGVSDRLELLVYAYRNKLAGLPPA
jgi:DNA-binding NarL/FixJ family response regulator